MIHKSIGEHPEITVRSNWLTVDDMRLRADVLRDDESEKLAVSSDELLRILLLGRRTILQSIENIYDQQVAKNPGASVVRPSIFTAQLGNVAQTEGRNSQVLTELGYANGGSWLLLRKPTLDYVIRDWFDPDHHIDHAAFAARAIRDEDKKKQREKLTAYRIFEEKRVDRTPDHLIAKASIALSLSVAAIKELLGNYDEYMDEIDSALDYADNDSSVEDGAVRAIENSVF